MSLDVGIEINPDGSMSVCGILISLAPGSDPNAKYELYRAPDSAGAPDTANTVLVYSGMIPASGLTFFDSLPRQSTPFWYQSRLVGGQLGPSNFTDWVNLGVPDRMLRDSLLALMQGDSTARLAAWQQTHSRIGPQGNLLPNPGFEDGEPFWAADQGLTFTYPQSAANARSGNRYAKLTSTTGVSAAIRACDDIGRPRYFEVNTNDLIQMGGYAYRESGTANVRFVIELTDKDKLNPTLITSPNVTTAAWTLSQAQTIVASGKKYARFWCEIDTTGTGTVARFDDAFFRIALSYIADTPAPNTLYEIRFAAAVPDPDTLDGVQTFIDFPATTYFMRVGQTPLVVGNSTNATPISVNVVGHGYSTGDRIVIRGHSLSAVNGPWTITVTDNDNFTLNGSTASGTGSGGHSVKLSLIIAPNGALTVFGTIIATIFNAVTATITGLLSALGGMLVRNTFQHSTTGNYLDTTVNRILMENNSFKLFGDMGSVGTNQENVRIGDYTVSLPPTARSTTNLNDPAVGSRGWNDPDSSPPSVTYVITANKTWTVPRDWNNANNTIVAIGAGGDGATGTANSAGGAGGGGGERRDVANTTLTPGNTVTITVGTGVDTVVGSIATAKKGSGSTGGTGGTGGTGHAGGAGGSGSVGTGNRGGGGGAGAGGDTAAGSVGNSGTSSAGGAGGAGGATGGGSGGAGATASSFAQVGGNGSNNSGGGGGGGFGGPDGTGRGDGNDGGLYGGGGGGGGSEAGNVGVPGHGRGGVCIITYTPATDNGMNAAARTTDGTTTIGAANRLYQKLGDSTVDANIPSYDNNYTIQFKVWADATNTSSNTSTVTSTVTVEYATDGTGSSWTSVGGSYSVTAGGSISGYPSSASQVFAPTLVVPGTPTHVWFRLTLAVQTTNTGTLPLMGLVQCFAATYKTDNYAATWATASGTQSRRGVKVFATRDGSSVDQPHASFSPTTAVGSNLVEGELQFVGGNVHGVVYQDDEATRYVAKLIGTEVNKTTAAGTDTKITTGIKIKNGRTDAAGRMLRIRAGGTIGANTGTVNLRLGTANTTADGAIATMTLASNDKWIFDVVLVIQSAGSPGTARVSGFDVHGTTLALITGTFSLTTTADTFLNVTGNTTSAVTLTVDLVEAEWLA